MLLWLLEEVDTSQEREASKQTTPTEAIGHAACESAMLQSAETGTPALKGHNL